MTAKTATTGYNNSAPRTFRCANPECRAEVVTFSRNKKYCTRCAMDIAKRVLIIK